MRIYPITDFSLNTIGSKVQPVLRSKAAETGSLVYFASDLADRFRLALPRGEALVIAGKALVSYLETTRKHDSLLPPIAVQALIDSAINFLRVREAAGIKYLPKMHLMVHLADQSRTYGNPRCLGATWIDESDNMALAAVCRTSHSAVWSRRVLATFAHPAAPTTRPAKRGRRG